MFKLTFVHAIAAALILQASAQQFVMYTPGGDDTTTQRIDPILNPGSISQHVHQIFGSNALAAEVTYESLLQSTCTTVADASNHGNSADHSLYWHPALYAEAMNGTGYVKIPTNGHKIYYKDAGNANDKKASPFEFPHGFRMIAGNPRMRSPPADLQQQNITQWICHASTGTNQGTSGGFPNGVTDCASVDGFNGAIHFPHCWNGADFDLTNPQAHVVYPTGDIENGQCPPSHPTRLPHIFMENTFDIHSVVDQVKPDTFVLAQGDKTGIGWHADFFNGWEDGAIPALLASCLHEYYGNEDVGVCTAFKAATIPANKCKQNTFYPEKVDYPGQNLPGCNPISDTNPAPVYAIAPLGTYGTDCTLASSGSNSGSSSSGASASIAQFSAASSSARVVPTGSIRLSPSSSTTVLPPIVSTSSISTTLATSAVTTSPSQAEIKAQSVTFASLRPMETETKWDIIVVTEIVTVTVR